MAVGIKPVMPKRDYHSAATAVLRPVTVHRMFLWSAVPFDETISPLASLSINPAFVIAERSPFR
jgi:hypothetical protein